MTILIASLFLPYTVNFDTTSQHIGREDVKPPGINFGSEQTCYFSLNPSTTTLTNPASSIPLTPGATTTIEKLFIPEILGSPLQLRIPAAQFKTNLRSLIRLEPHPPGWGQDLYGTQPKSRASQPPPASILEHAKIAQSAPRENTQSYKPRKNRTFSNHERRFSQSKFTVDLGALGNSALFSAIEAASDNGILDDKIWIGTLGMPTEEIEDCTKSNIAEKLKNECASVAVFVNDSDLSGHYEHYCKIILWPILHYQIPDHPKSKAYEDHSWIFYVRVNQAFADNVVKNWKHGDEIWVHDYHLMLVPGMIRKQLPDARIGFYLHAAFPSSEIFRCLAVRIDLLGGLLGANLVGFQTEEHVHHFLQTCSRLLHVEATKQGIIMEDGRVVHVDKFPMGVDPPTIDARRQHEDVREWIRVISEKYRGKHLVVARDQLDGVHGVKQKLLAYELFLDKFPELGKNVVLIQIATATTEVSGLSSDIADVVTRINSHHATLAHQPLVFLKQDIDHFQWLALLTIADGLMITSLREGMNLTGHEFIYCQDGKLDVKKHAPLILSEFTGSAALLRKGAILVNPWHYRQCAEAIKTALDMSAKERALRWYDMYEAISEHDAIHWFKSYIEALDRAAKDHAFRAAISVPPLSYSVVSKKYNDAAKRLLLLDYEGTLAVWGSPDDTIHIHPKKALDILNDLADDRKNTVYVMSSRRSSEMEQTFKLVPGVGMIAEDGAYLLEARSTEWVSLVDAEHVAKWKVDVGNSLRYYEERIEKSRIEEMGSGLIFNYAATDDKQSAFKQAAECANHINNACMRQKVHALPIDDGIRICSAEVNRSSATRMIEAKMQQNLSKKGVPLPDFLLAIGASREDEYVFDWAHGMQEKGIRDVVTVTVGRRNTSASCAVTQGVTGVLSTLQKLAACQTVSERSRLDQFVTGLKRMW